MKIRILLTLIIAGFFASCEKEDNGDIKDAESVNKWLYSNMKSHYLWSASMPQLDNTDLKRTPLSYMEQYIRYRYDRSVSLSSDIYGDRFSSLSKKDGDLYSRSAIGRRSYADSDIIDGFGIEVASVENLSEIEYFIVIYVVPGSPAHKAGVSRGDCFRTINGKTVTTEYSKITNSLDKIEIDFIYPRNYSVTINRESFANTPVVFDTVYKAYGAPTGYVVYTHFTSGDNDRFNNELKHVFGRFKEAKVKNVIIDFRYNGGGELDAAMLVGSLLVPKNNLGSVMTYLERNSNFGNPDKFQSEYFFKEKDVGSYNPDAESIYIITSQYTASASELVIHALKPYLNNNLRLVGWRTVGKNIGGITISSPRSDWEISAITIRLYDCNKISGYEAGIDPNVERKEYFVNPQYNLMTVGSWGDPINEILLNNTMSLIYPDADFETNGKRLSKSVRTVNMDNYSVEITTPLNELIEGRYITD